MTGLVLFHSSSLLSGHDSIKMALEVRSLRGRAVLSMLLLLALHVIQLLLFGSRGQVDVDGMDPFGSHLNKVLFLHTSSPVPVFTAKLHDIAGVALSHLGTRDPKLLPSVLGIGPTRRDAVDGGRGPERYLLLASVRRWRWR